MIYSTENTALAVTLSTLGVPFADPQNPDWLCYTPGDLEKAGVATAEQARDKGAAGNRRYFFEDHPDRARIVEEFERTARSQPGAIEMPELSAGDLAIFAALLLGNRKRFLAAQKLTPPKMMFRRGDGSYAIVGKSAKPEDLARLGLK